MKTEASGAKEKDNDVDTKAPTTGDEVAGDDTDNKTDSKTAEASSVAGPVVEEPTSLAEDTKGKSGDSDDKTLQTGETKTETGVVKKKIKRFIGDDLDDVIMPCEIFDTREAFLLYCQNNHCQFDQIRRAKHSSMMVLYHLFNQGTTGFTFSCSNCKTTLLSGNRWNCSICPVFNLCDTCHAKTKHEHQLHLFKVVPIPRPGNEVSNETVSTKVKGVVSKAGGAAGRAIKREPGSSDLKRTKHAKHAAEKKATSARKRKLPQSSPVATPVASPGVKSETPSPAVAEGSAVTTPTAAGAASGSNGNTSDGDAAKKRRIHNIDPQLLLQLEHASSCTVPNCTYFNCNRMQAKLKHGAICEQRLAGPCVLCKRIIGLLSAHARQCTKDYSSCKVPRCADIRRHFLAQVQARQQQLQRARQAQQAANPDAAATATASTVADSATVAAAEETKNEAS
ncbi:Hypothetical protein PHPALM_1818 [Phytophthora palmivora]|uniref:histone acetyltransferase n=1 Tax=Phytophthora palmivora TaxID=4796 RepID=A0A2P4YRA1_9STRA|nr:Hypothetical protein PHPALM_1818 [Phytophthora palmivora]